MRASAEWTGWVKKRKEWARGWCFFVRVERRLMWAVTNYKGELGEEWYGV